MCSNWWNKTHAHAHVHTHIRACPRWPWLHCHTHQSSLARCTENTPTAYSEGPLESDRASVVLVLPLTVCMTLSFFICKMDRIMVMSSSGCYKDKIECRVQCLAFSKDSMSMSYCHLPSFQECLPPSHAYCYPSIVWHEKCFLWGVSGPEEIGTIAPLVLNIIPLLVQPGC